MTTATNVRPRRGGEQCIVPLNAAQEALWYTQHALGDTPLTIAQYMDITGDLDVGALREAADSVGRAMGTTITGVTERDGRPYLVVDDARRAPSLEVIDLRDAQRPAQAARERMDSWSRSPLPIDSEHLVSSALLRVDDRQWFLFTRAHHIVLDGFGAYVLLRNIAREYQKLLGRPQPASARPQLWASGAHADTSATAGQRSLLSFESTYRESDRYQRDRDYWAAVMARLPAPTTLARRSAPPSLEPILAAGHIDPALAVTISETADRLRHNSTAIVIAALALYLSRASGQPVVSLSLPVAGRITGALRKTAGSVSNIVPIVLEARADMTVSAFISQVSAALTGALRHQTYRHEQMLRDLGAVTADISHVGPVVNVFPARLVVDLGDDLTADYHVLTTGPVADLNVNIYPSGDSGSPAIDFEANPGRYDPSTVTQHRDNLIAMLESICVTPEDELLVAVTIPSEGPRDGPQAPRPVALDDLLARHRDSPDRAVVDEATVLSHAELAHAVERLQNTLRANKIGIEDRVAVVLPRSLAEVIAFHAVAAVGACYVPVDPHYPPARQQLVIETSRPSLILTAQVSTTVDTSPHVPRLQLGPRGEHAAEAINTEAVNTEAVVPTAPVERAAYLIFTSGSTGTPKGVVATDTGLASLAEQIRRSYGLTPDSVVARAASTAFDTSVVELLAAAVTGATLVVIPDGVFGGAELADSINAHGVTHLMTTPGVLATLDPTTIATVTHIIVGGDVCPPGLIRRFADQAVVRCAYGPTEASCSVTITEPFEAQSMSDIPVPIGHPMVGVRPHILDHRLQPVPAGVGGELYISGPSLARGYLDDPALSAARFVADPSSVTGGRMYRTGDRVAWRADGSLDFLGRTDHQVKVRGVRIEPAEIDSALRALPGVRDALTVAVRQNDSPLLASYVTTSIRLSGNVIRQALAESLPAHMVPSAVTTLNELPLTPAGKVDRGALPPPAFLASAPYRSAVSTDEQHVIKAFSAATGRTTIGADDDFFELGGDSLSATAIVAALNAERHVALSVRDVFECRTPAALAGRLRSAERATPLTHRTQEPDTFSLAPAQRNVDVGDHSAANSIPFTVEVAGTLDRSSFARAVAVVTHTHPMMRTRFVDGNMVVDQQSAVSPTIATLADQDRSLTEFLHQPFDLTDGHPIRFGIHEGPSATILAIAAHHVAIDGWSLSIIADDLVTAYSAEVASEVAPLRPKPAQQVDFFDYSGWANNRLGDHTDPTSLAHKQLEFWRSELANVPSVAALAVDRPRPTTWDRAASRERITLQHHWSDIVDVARAHSVSTTTVLRASLARVLLSASDQPAIVIGTPVSGRVNSQLQNIVGMFVNTVPVVCRRDDVQSARDLPAVATAELRALSHADIPYVEVAAALPGIDPHGSAHPLFQVVLSIEDGTPTSPVMESGRRSGVVITPRPPDIAKCDLHCAVTGGPDGFIDVLYPVSMFDAGSVAALLQTWLEQINAWR